MASNPGFLLGFGILDFVMQLKGEVRLPRNGIEKYCLRTRNAGDTRQYFVAKKEQFSEVLGMED